MSLPPTPSKLLASRFAHLAYSPSSKNAKASSSNLSPTKKKKKRVSSDIDSSDLDEEEEPVQGRADQDLREDGDQEIKKEEEKDSLILAEPERESSPYFPSSSSSQLKRKLSTSSLPPFSNLPSSSPTKKKSSQAPPRPYAEPERYDVDHPPLTDLMCFDADVMFCGINPGLSSAKKGHHYAGATNRFWNCLYQSGLTPTLLTPSQDHLLPIEHNICMTNLVPRPTAAASELSSHLDLRPSVPSLLTKIRTYRPRVVCFVGKEIWREVEFVLRKTKTSTKPKGSSGSPKKGSKGSKGKQKEEEEGGLGEEKQGKGNEWEGPRGWKLVHPKEDEGGEEGRVRETFFWVVSSTSGLVRDSMHLRLSTQWTPLLTFITDLKAGVQPWLVPQPKEREFQVVPSNEVVERVAGELKERYLREKAKAKEKAMKGEGDGEEGVGGVKEEEMVEKEEEVGSGSWRVVEVLMPSSGGSGTEGRREEVEGEEG